MVPEIKPQSGTTITRWTRATLLLVLFFLAMNFIDYGSMRSFEMAHMFFYYGENPAKAAFYLASYAVSIGAIVVLLFSASALVRNLTLMFITVLLGIEFVGQAVYGKSPGCNEAQVLLAETAFAGEAITAYKSEILEGITKAGVALLFLITLLCLIRMRFGRRWLVLVPISLAMAYAGVWKSAARCDIYPSPIKIPVVIAYTLLNSVYGGPRDAVELKTSGQEPGCPRHLILVVDESVRGDFLGINGCPMDTTPFLSTYPNLMNFGIACSATNFSAGTNIILQGGTRLDQLPDVEQLTVKRPNIFQYARAAGFKTYFLDGQGSRGGLNNYMTYHDLAYIDEFYQAFEHNGDKAVCQNDFLIARKIKQIVAANSPAFIYVNKHGAHFSYDNCYPSSKAIFTPTSSDDWGPDGVTLNDKKRNSYANAIRWSVDGFFEELLPSLNLKDTCLLYTSDHGQSLGEGGIRVTHGLNVNPPSVQANVPLFLVGECGQKRFSPGNLELLNTRSHFQIFPTLLSLMGFDEAQVTRQYGEPLWSLNKPPQRFLSGDVFGRGFPSINEFNADIRR